MAYWRRAEAPAREVHAGRAPKHQSAKDAKNAKKPIRLPFASFAPFAFFADKAVLHVAKEPKSRLAAGTRSRQCRRQSRCDRDRTARRREGRRAARVAAGNPQRTLFLPARIGRGVRACRTDSRSV